jgi:hypothetical protein
LDLKQRHLDRPLHPIDREVLRRILREGYFGLAYTESNRGHLRAAWKALREARINGLPISVSVAEAGKSAIRAMRGKAK